LFQEEFCHGLQDRVGALSRCVAARAAVPRLPRPGSWVAGPVACRRVGSDRADAHPRRGRRCRAVLGAPRMSTYACIN